MHKGVSYIRTGMPEKALDLICPFWKGRRKGIDLGKHDRQMSGFVCFLEGAICPSGSFFSLRQSWATANNPSMVASISLICMQSNLTLSKRKLSSVPILNAAVLSLSAVKRFCWQIDMKNFCWWPNALFYYYYFMEPQWFFFAVILHLQPTNKIWNMDQ